jgi:hypothetical protein
MALVCADRGSCAGSIIAELRSCAAEHPRCSANDYHEGGRICRIGCTAGDAAAGVH